MSVEAVDIKQDRSLKLSPTRKMRRANEDSVTYNVTVPVETALDDLLNPVYWAHHAGLFTGQINYVRVHWEDKSQLVHLYVREYTQTAAKMELLDRWDFDESVSLVVPERYAITWTGPNTKYRVTRIEDQQVIRDSFSNKSDALAFIEKLPR